MLFLTYPPPPPSHTILLHRCFLALFCFLSLYGRSISIKIMNENHTLYVSRCNEIDLIYNMYASKAYDRVNHWTLFKKLLKRSISVIIVRILMFWYSNQNLCIKWATRTSSFFTISNGVRQGGILSPVLFSI